MSEEVQVSQTGNRPNPFSWSLSSTGRLQRCEQAVEDCSGQLRLFRCNNCNVQGLAEYLRVYSRTENYTVYFHKRSGSKRLTSFTRQLFPLEILLCNDCKPLYKTWVNGHPKTGSSSEKQITPLINIAFWSRAYWRKRASIQQGQATSGVSIPRWQIPSGPAIGEVSSSPQDLC